MHEVQSSINFRAQLELFTLFCRKKVVDSSAVDDLRFESV